MNDATQRVEARARRMTVPEFSARKGGTPLVCLTAYTAPMARLLDPHVDMLLVGDSLGMVIYGYESTLPVTLEQMIAHGAAVVGHSRQALVVVDMPFGSYQAAPSQAFLSAAKMIAQTGCGAVKLEGGEAMAETVSFLAQRGIPVMGHVGLMPQSVNAVGGYRARGRTAHEGEQILHDAKAIAAAGAFAIVIEGVQEDVARKITAEVAVPCIGIGASAACDGQVLVVDDILGLFNDFTPRFVKRFAELGQQVTNAAKTYAGEVRARHFPGPEHCFKPKGE